MKFGRIVRIQFEPIDPESERVVTKKEFYCDGSRSTYDCDFTVDKEMAASTNNKAEITLYNLSHSTIQNLATNFSKYYCQILVAHEGEKFSKLFGGALRRVWYSKNSLDKKVEISLYKAELQRQYLASFSLKKDGTGRLSYVTVDSSVTIDFNGYSYSNVPELIEQVAKIYKRYQYPRLKVVGARIVTASFKRDIMRKKVAESISFSNKTFDEIVTTLCNQYGLTWTICDDEFWFSNDSWFSKNERGASDSTLQKQTFYIGPGSLMSCEICLEEGRGMFQTGVKVDAVLNPNVVPGSKIELESNFYKDFNGVYNVHNVSFSGSTIGSDWKMTIDAKPPRNLFGRMKDAIGLGG